ncbi:hypothetical protein Pedsa_1536 [Pseudopedobacter saltans DSM 12145]|uniref:Uncharacterized protein n=1 Tax=Pseudopedobacter saltans (strain ATCC 51119 / DSM 12145 / JCM 21818 / CCUG 39354 / LMG 10337 / NBRC 100064 / NCIMB 13643) TaxID=762903 RepID=F0S5Z2_PSESL|nr:hypothetical protein [Pseudopedobacter saltans]ADY52095.1 hypothetical protein Pedsa_1536 [Pseudopedobacter saltans DSM 12145]
MSTLIFGDNDYLNINKDNFLDFPLLAAFLSSKRDNTLNSDEENSIEREKFNEEPRVDLLSEK